MGSQFQDILVAAPNVVTIERALMTLGHTDVQRRLLDQVLTTFGHHLIDPLGAVLDPGPDGALMRQLTTVRDRVIADLASLQVTSETRSIVIQDITKMMSDDYLAMLVEHEERELRPRVRELAQEILRLVGDIFHKALGRWPDHARSIAHAVRRRLSGEVPPAPVEGRVQAEAPALSQRVLPRVPQRVLVQLAVPAPPPVLRQQPALRPRACR